jgi:AmiR/NasT family two-component response regulator
MTVSTDDLPGTAFDWRSDPSFAVNTAEGILIERHGITAAGAGSMLDGRSRVTGLSLVEVARRLISTGLLP